jgi:putative flippase GtrA
MRGLDENRRSFIKQAVKFAFVGGMNTAVTFLAYALLYRLLGLDEYWANGIGYALGLINSFIWNKLWTFRSKGWKPLEVLAFLAVFAVSYAIQLGFYRLFRMSGLGGELAELLAMAPYTAANFAGNKLVTFKKGESNVAQR